MTGKAYLAGLALAIALAAGFGCGDDDGNNEAPAGGDGELALEQYYNRIEEISAELEQDLERFDEQLAEVDQTDEAEAIEGIREYFRKSQQAFEDAIDRVDALDPPPEPEEEHEEFVQAGRAIVESSGDFYEELQQVESLDAAESLFADTPELDEAEEQFASACARLQSIAVENEIEADLGCGEVA